MSKIINAVLSRFSAKYKSIDELGKLYLAQLQTKDYAAKTIQNKTCYVNHPKGRWLYYRNRGLYYVATKPSIL